MCVRVEGVLVVEFSLMTIHLDVKMGFKILAIFDRKQMYFLDRLLVSHAYYF